MRDRNERRDGDDRRHDAPHRRTTDKLLTLDRAMLAGIFAAGMWYASTDLRAGNVQERIAKIEKERDAEREASRVDAISHAAEVATVKQQLREIDRRTESIEENLGKLAESTARLANAVKDPH